MDDYPAHLAPAFADGGGVATPFGEWWPRVANEFPTVPENVAQYWLYEHWGHSPYRYLRSRDYRFDLINWQAADLPKIRSCWCNFADDNLKCLEHGKHLATLTKSPFIYRTAEYMLAHGDFPAPVIVLDNRDGHISRDGVPVGHILIEGHRRFNLALYLQQQGRLKPHINIWQMSRA